MNIKKHFCGLFAQCNNPPHNKNNFINCRCFNEYKPRLGNGQLRQFMILYVFGET
jgi:hypothetical protein